MFKYYIAAVVAAVLTIAIFPLAKILAFKIFPAEFHPLGWSMVFVALIWASLSYVSAGTSLRWTSTFGASFGWLGWILAREDHVCHAGYAGFLSFAILFSLRFLVVIIEKKDTTYAWSWENIKPNIFLVVISLMTMASLFSIYLS